MPGRGPLQGVIKSYDPLSGDGTVICDSDLAEYELGRDALAGSVFRMLRQGQRVVFDLDERSFATSLRTGAEADMGTPSSVVSDVDATEAAHITGPGT